MDLSIGRAREEYTDLVQAFREVTTAVWPGQDGRCCARVHGVERMPDCCWKVSFGAESLTWTMQEMMLLADHLQLDWLVQVGINRWQFRKNDQVRNWMAASMHDGLLANTLECASHPMRPVLGEAGQVIGVVVVSDCNADLIVDGLRKRHGMLMEMWQDAVNLVGRKDYYAHYELRPDWRIV